MFKQTKAFSGFAADDIAAAKTFYGETLGLEMTEEHGMLTLHLAGDRPTLIYPKPDHVPATYTILNFPVEDIDRAVEELAGRGNRLLGGRDRQLTARGVDVAAAREPHRRRHAVVVQRREKGVDRRAIRSRQP